MLNPTATESTAAEDWTPITAAEEVFKQSLSAVMAHAIRGTQNFFYSKGVNLQVRIVPDTYNQIKLKAPGSGVTSILMTYLVEHTADQPIPTLQAVIQVHRDANRNLARICVAHEIYHLFMELVAFRAHPEQGWPQIEFDKVVEDKCNQFALEFCRRHDDFYRNIPKMESAVYFPKGMFQQPISTNENQQNTWWPGVGLDPAHPFNKVDHLC